MEQELDDLDGYVFFHSRTSWLKVCQWWKDGTVRFACQNTSGPDEVVAFLSVPKGHGDKDAMKEKIDKVKTAANPSSSDATATRIAITAPSRWSDKMRYCAHVRIKATLGMKAAVFDELDPRGQGAPIRHGQGLNGMAECDGAWDVLVELGANTPDELSGLVDIVLGMPHVDRTNTLVTTTLMEKRQPRPPDVCEEWK